MSTVIAMPSNSASTILMHFFGTGSGQLALDLDGGAAERYRADLSMTMAAAGVRGEIVTPAEAGGFALALKADAFWVRTESDSVSAPGVGNLAAARADASRVRAMLDGSRTFALAGGATLTPKVELGLRHDGGDAETGTGTELGAGIGYADPSRGLDMALRVRAQTAADLEAAAWGLLAWEDPHGEAGPASPFWIDAPMLEMVPAPEGPTLVELLGVPGVGLSGLRLAGGAAIVKVEDGEGCVQIRIADGAGFDPAGGVDLRLPTLLGLRMRLHRAADLWPIAVPETKKDAARGSPTGSC